VKFGTVLCATGHCSEDVVKQNARKRLQKDRASDKLLLSTEMKICATQTASSGSIHTGLSTCQLLCKLYCVFNKSFFARTNWVI